MKALSIVLKRLAWGMLLVFGVTTVAWGLTALLPGDPVRAAMGPQAAPADVERARKLYGLDDPVFVRYGRFLVRLVHSDSEPAGKGEHASCAEVGPVHVDLGTSFSYRRPIVELIRKKFPASLELAVAASVIQALIGLVMGGLAAARRGGRVDHAIVGTAVALGAAPTFVVGLLLQYVLAHRLGAFPVDGGYTWTGAEHLRAIALPALTLGFYGAALLVRLVRSELAGALGEPYVLAVRARGATRLRAGVVHALRNASAPIVQLGVLELGALAGGAVVTERLFRWPGIGEMAVVAVQNRDAQAIVGVTLVASCAIVLATVVADLIGVLLDPRQRAES
jgi:peptide/nickel transport system permease protein